MTSLKMQWSSVERASDKLGLKGLADNQALVMVLNERKGSCESVHRRTISVGQFKKQLWELYDSKKLLSEIVILNPKDNTVIYHFLANSQETSLEIKPTKGQPWLIKDWGTFSAKRRETLLKLLMTQIMECDDV